MGIICSNTEDKGPSKKEKKQSEKKTEKVEEIDEKEGEGEIKDEEKKCGTENLENKLEKEKISKIINDINKENTAKNEIIKENNDCKDKNRIDSTKESETNLNKISNQKNNMHYIIGYKIPLNKDSLLKKENNTYNIINDSKIQLELKVLGQNDIPNNIISVKGNFTIDELEKKFNDEKYIFDRGMSIRNLKKTLLELHSNQNILLSFYLMKKSDKLIKDLEECEINLINIYGASCYQSATMQGFVHIIFPIAIRNINYHRQKKGNNNVEDLDELKNDNIYNNTVIDTIKGLLEIQKSGNGGIDKNGNIRFRAEELFKILPPIKGGGQGIQNIYDIDSNNKNLISNSKERNDAINALNNLKNKIEDLDNKSEKSNKNSNKGTIIVHNPPKKRLINKSITESESVKSIEITKNTIVSEIMKFKIEECDKYYGNIVLEFSENDLKDENLDICKLIENCPQFNNKKIVETSDVLYLITDRILQDDAIKKQFIVYEKIYFQNIDEWFELKFVIYHHYSGPNYGHYVAYSKFRGEWHYFNDLNNDYAVQQTPPLYDKKEENYYPVSFYYVKIKNDN